MTACSDDATPVGPRAVTEGDAPGDVADAGTQPGNEMASDPIRETESGMRMTATLVGTDGVLSFILPTGDTIEYEASELVGKPYLVAIFNAGVQSGVDEPLHRVWSTVPEDLVIEYASPELPDGPYDLSLIIYPLRDITEEDQQSPFAPVPLTGELSAFTISQAEVREGDPGLTNGVVRVNVEGGTAQLALENRPTFVDTVMAVP